MVVDVEIKPEDMGIGILICCNGKSMLLYFFWLL
jgi:hypothetical protein